MLEQVKDSMLLVNPPEHTRLRRLVSAAFTPRHVADLTAAVTHRADQFPDRLTAGGGGDFMRAFAMVYPMNVIADLLGVPDTDRDHLTPLIYAAQPHTILAAVEELLRYEPPFQLDARVHTDLDTPDTTRYLSPGPGAAPAPHLSFASGIHYCLGAHLTRLEITTALTRLLARHPEPRPAALPTRRPGLTLRGYSHLPIRLTSP